MPFNGLARAHRAGATCLQWSDGRGSGRHRRKGMEAMPDLAGKIALVTGATSGIGRAIADHFAACGAKLMLTARNQSAGLATAKQLEAKFLAGDIADPAFPDRLVEATLAAFGRLDILVNN